MELIDLNVHGGIGANSLLVRIGGFNLLVDAGLHPKVIGARAMPDFSPVPAEGLDLILLTHTHLDHIGALPVISRRHPEARIVTSFPNSVLGPRMLRNSINVMKRQRSEHAVPEYPLFTHREVAAAAKRFVVQRFGHPESYRKDGREIAVTLYPAGHVAGATAIEVEHQGRRILFSGDLLFESQRTLPGAHLPQGPLDTLILETTRGATARAAPHERPAEVDRLYLGIGEILDRGGSCLIPVFALGRMQELLKIIHEGRAFGRLPRCPVYATGLGMDLANLFNKIRKQSNLVDFDAGLLEKLGVAEPDPNMVPGRTPARPGLFVLSSGMMVEHTPSYKAAASLLRDARNGVCFVGYCDPDTPGGKLIEAAEAGAGHFFFEAYDYRSELRADIRRFDLSGHADREQLVDYAVASGARSIVLTHGDPEARAWFAGELSRQAPTTQVTDPEPLHLYNL